MRPEFDAKLVLDLWAARLGIEATGRPGFSCARRRSASEALYDLVSSEDVTLAALNGVPYDAWKERLGDAAPSEAGLRAWIADSIAPPPEPDTLWYCDASRLRSVAAPDGVVVRELDERDLEAFLAFERNCPEAEASLVAAEDELIVGAFERGSLVARAGAVPAFGDPDDPDPACPVYDVRCVTLPERRRSGLARRCVAELCRLAFARGAIVQARTGPGDAAATALARSLGFFEWARWTRPASVGD